MTIVTFCCSMSRMADSRSYSIMPPSSLGSNNSMESAKTAAQREPQQRFPGLTEQAREAAALVEWLHAQVRIRNLFFNLPSDSMS
jgi:hypothetical protein